MSNEQYNINDLIRVMAALRNPDGGCPWDLEQDFKSIIPYTIEEVYEVADAIDKGDMVNLREELGDLLLQPIYHAQMAAEQKHFDIHNVIHDITDKMITRHPHVFGDTDANSADDVNAIWDTQKAKEKATNGANKTSSVLDNVPAALPALLRASKLQKRAAKTGFAWTNTGQILDKLEEEIAELREALENKDKENQQEELGDILFVMANIGRLLDINPEEALRQANNKFTRRFQGIEADYASRGASMNDASLDELMTSWNVQKLKG